MRSYVVRVYRGCGGGEAALAGTVQDVENGTTVAFCGTAELGRLLRGADTEVDREAKRRAARRALPAARRRPRRGK